jgi:photosystem II stability/assembly factor-like uncharacterized protein
MRRFFAEDTHFISGDITFANPKRGWVFLVTGRRKIFRTILYRTEDGGETWIRNQFRPVGKAQKLLFADQTKGVLAVVKPKGYTDGHSTDIYSTTDGGNSWKIESSLSGVARDMLLKGNSEILLCGRNGLLRNSKDWGKNWAKVESPTRSTIESLHLRGPVGIAAGNRSPIVSRSSVAILVSRDAGLTWRKVPSPICASIVGVYLTGWDRGVIAAADAFYQFRLKLN